MMAGRNDSRWATFKQITEHGGKVNKGAQGVAVCYYGSAARDRAERPAEDNHIEQDNVADKEKFFFMRTYFVFNVGDTTGLNLPNETVQEKVIPVIERCENLVNSIFAAPKIVHGNGNRAYYHMSTDTIHLPMRDAFVSSEAYYATKFHELVHATGHESRTGRLVQDGLPVLFGDDIYSREELVAELGSFFLCTHMQIDTPVRDNQQAYLASWLRVLKSEPKMLLSAASAAQKATDHILGH